MAEKVFVIGAGFNQCIVRNFGSDEVPEYFSPPMSKNFLQFCLKTRQIVNFRVLGITPKLLSYIEENFSRSVNDLVSSEFDLELLFTFVEGQIADALITNAKKRLNYLKEIRLHLIIAIGETFFEWEYRTGGDDNGRKLLLKFAEVIYQTRSDIITFNYDCLLEREIEVASGENKKKKETSYNNGQPFYNWDRYSAYDVKFTAIRMGPNNNYWHKTNGRNVAPKFYKKYYAPHQGTKFIKLHGSINWFRYSNLKFSKMVDLKSYRESVEYEKRYQIGKIPEKLEGEMMCFNGDWEFGAIPIWSRYKVNPLSRYRNVLEPVIIPPILLKENEIRKDVFWQLWNLAKETLLKTKEIVFIGYSFPDTDFYSKKLFIEAFSENKNIKVTIVNPDLSIAEKFKGLVNYKDEITLFRGVEEFLQNIR